MKYTVGDKFLMKDNYTVLNLLYLDDTSVVFLPFNKTEFSLVGPLENIEGLLEGATALEDLDFKRRLVAFDAWEGTVDQDDNQPETYITDFDSHWSTVNEEVINTWFDMQGHVSDETLQKSFEEARNEEQPTKQ